MLAASDAANRLGLSARAIYALHAAGRLPGYRFGRALRFEPADVEAYRAAHRVAASPPIQTARVLREYDKLRRTAGSDGPRELTEREMSIAYDGYRNKRAARWADTTAERTDAVRRRRHVGSSAARIGTCSCDSAGFVSRVN